MKRAGVWVLAIWFPQIMPAHAGIFDSIMEAIKKPLKLPNLMNGNFRKT